MYLCHTGTSFKILSCWKSGSCIQHHLWTLLMDNPSALDKSWIVTHQFSKISFFICAALTFIHHMLYLSVWSLPWMSCLIICKLFTVFWLMYLHYTFTIALYQLAITFNWRNLFHYNNSVTLWTTSWHEVSSVIAIADQLVP